MIPPPLSSVIGRQDYNVTYYLIRYHATRRHTAVWRKFSGIACR